MDQPLVVVLRTGEAALLPLVRIALEQEGIDYTVRNSGLSEFIIGNRTTSTVGNAAPPFEVMVLPEDAERARNLLVDLETSQPKAGIDVPGDARLHAAAAEQGSVELIDVESGVPIGRLSLVAFESIADHLELESEDDHDYFIDGQTIAMLEEAGADADAVEMLRRALGTRPGMDVKWKRS